MIRSSWAIIILFLFLHISCFGQQEKRLSRGKVSFLSSNHVYVKFDNTKKINVGDTLWYTNEAFLSPCLVVRQKSSTSTVCDLSKSCKLKKGDVLIHTSKMPKENAVKKKALPKTKEGDKKKPKNKNIEEKDPASIERIRGRISASSYSNRSSGEAWRHRTMYRLSLDADNINDSKFSLETYLNYRQNFIPAGEINDRQTKFFKVYNLAMRYDVDTTMSITLGRKINYNASSLGAIDGLQVDKYFGTYFSGLIIGFRPDIYDYSINPGLLQYGAYIGKATNSKGFYSQTTLGLLEQRNAGITDRRYAYFQHSSTINRKLNIFTSLELDLYQKLNSHVTNNVNLTNFYASVRYRFNRKVSLNLSFDSRKRIIHYETFKTDIERLLEDDEARKGIRARLNIRPIKYVNTGFSYSKRFQSSRVNKSENLNGYISWSRVPLIRGRLSANYNLNTSSYLKSQILGVRYSRPLFHKRINADTYFRWVRYRYIRNDFQTGLKYYGVNLSYRVSRKLVLSVLGELSTRTTGDNYRINTKIIQRFDRKKR